MRHPFAKTFCSYTSLLVFLLIVLRHFGMLLDLRFPFVRTCLLALMAALCWPLAAHAAPAVALYYGEPAGLADFRAFDLVVVDPDHYRQQPLPAWDGTQFYAYASVTEVQPSRTYYADIPVGWKIGRNPAWGSDLIDQSAPGWPEFFATRVIAPLWAQGYRGFFLDTLDSYRLAERFDEQAQQQGLVQLIRGLHQRFPGIRLMLNRGFDIVPQLPGQIEWVAAESLYRRWNATQRQYEEVPEADRNWLLGQLQQVRERHGLPVLVIDYVPPHDRTLARATAQKILADGFTPWVSNAELSGVGMGSIEPVARRILVVYSSAESPALNYSDAHRFLQMPLNHLGYTADYADAQQPLPESVFLDRYAGIVLSFSGYLPETRFRALEQWLLERLDQSMPIALVGSFPMPMPPSRKLAQRWGLMTDTEPHPPLHVDSRHAMLGLETTVPLPSTSHEMPRLTSSTKAQVLVQVRDGRGQNYVSGALMPWGGYILEPYTFIEIPGSDQYRWVIDPFAFLTQALRLPAIPVPDTTTENGRRLLLAHVDGDGFPSLAELPGSPLAAEVLLRDVFMRYRIPQTMSVIEAEVAPHGLYPAQSPQLQAIAKAMFKLPHIEAASHTYSHPFLWDRAVRHGVFKDDGSAAYQLPLPNYQFDLQREIVGSVAYIRDHLVPQGKPVRILQWSGDTAPSTEALKITEEAGLLNINGGDTFITRANPSLTAIGALGIHKAGHLQVYAPITNENIYTNLWKGPFYGFERAIETFELTNAPRRIKPVGIYYHTYSASKPAGLKALHKVYGWALAQPLHPVFTSEFIAKVQDFHGLALAREGEGWRVRGNGALRTLRLPTVLGAAQPERSRGVAGWSEGPEGTYAHLTGGQAWLRTAPMQTPAAPALHDANARITHWDMQAQGGEFQLQGHGPLEFSLHLPSPCQVRAHQRTLAPQSSPTPARTDIRHFRLNDVTARIQIHCPAR